MSSEGGTPQPPPGGGAKAPPKPGAFVSSFINKNAGGKKFAPRAAVRRRPGAAASVAKPSTPTPAPETPPVDQQPTVEAGVESVTADNAALPTPAATQEQPAGNGESDVTPVPLLPNEPETVAQPADVPARFAASPVPPQEDAPERQQPAKTPRSQGDAATASLREASDVPAQKAVESGKNQAQEDTLENVSLQTAPQTQTNVLESSQVTTGQDVPEEQEQTSNSAPEAFAGGHVQAPSEQVERAERSSGPPTSSVSVPHLTPDATASSKPTAAVPVQTQPQDGPEQTATWAPINQTREHKDDETEAGASTRAKRKRKQAAPAEIPQDEAEEGHGEDGSAISRKRTRVMRARAVEDDAKSQFTIEAPPKKPRKPRKDKGMKRKGREATAEEGEANNEGSANEGADAGASVPKPRKVSRKRKKASASTTDGAEPTAEGTEDATVTRRGRRPREREPTPSDAEDEVINESATFMSNLASRNIRTGKLSNREKQMRLINWDEVKERRRREETSLMNGKDQAEVDERLDKVLEAQQDAHNQNAGPRMRVGEDGQIELVPESNFIDAEADADMEINAYDEVEEDDLTQRITSKSFLRDSKRFPSEFLLPGQGKRWTTEGTEAFYEALQMFGTDFMMISTLFPGVPRRSIKTKFNREERENPARLKEALAAQRNTDWKSYLSKSTIAEADFKDPKAIEEELRAEREAMQVDIDEAKAAAEETKRQRKLAGLDSDDEGEAGKENADGKKKRKKGEKQSGTPVESEPGVEILGEVEDDDY